MMKRKASTRNAQLRLLNLLRHLSILRVNVEAHVVRRLAILITRRRVDEVLANCVRPCEKIEPKGWRKKTEPALQFSSSAVVRCDIAGRRTGDGAAECVLSILIGAKTNQMQGGKEEETKQNKTHRLRYNARKACQGARSQCVRPHHCRALSCNI